MYEVNYDSQTSLCKQFPLSYLITTSEGLLR